MAPYSSTLAWKIPWTEEPGRLQSMGSQRIGHDWATSLSCFGEGNGNPLQCSCLENPRDGGIWWAAVCGVAQSQAWLKRLSSSSSILPEHPMGGPASLALGWHLWQAMFTWHFNTLGCGLIKRAIHLQVSFHFSCLKIQFHTFFHFINEMLCFKPRGLPARWSYNYAWAVCSCA